MNKDFLFGHVLSGGDAILSLSLIKYFYDQGKNITYYISRPYSDLIVSNPYCKVEIVDLNKDSKKATIQMDKILFDASLGYKETCFPMIYPKNFSAFLADPMHSFKWHMFKNAGLELTPEYDNYIPELFPSDKDIEQARGALSRYKDRKIVICDFIAKSIQYDMRIIPELISKIDSHAFWFVTNHLQFDPLPQDVKDALLKNKQFILLDEFFGWKAWYEVIRNADYHIGLDSGCSYLAAINSSPSIICRSRCWADENSAWRYLFPWIPQEKYVELYYEDCKANVYQFENDFMNRIHQWEAEPKEL